MLLSEYTYGTLFVCKLSMQECRSPRLSPLQIRLECLLRPRLFRHPRVAQINKPTK
jgi:hypothetical protein